MRIETNGKERFFFIMKSEPSRRTGITDTIFRDAHQSLMATRMKTEDMLAIAEELDGVGFHSLEVWGGATFDSCLRFLNEDPWQRLRDLKKHIKNTPLQMLLRGQNLLGYRHYPDDVVEEFVKKSIENGIDIIRIFDALNDVRNMELAIKATKKYGGHAQASVVYTKSPVHDVQHYVKTAKELKAMGADSLCIKDMAGLLAPYDACELVSELKKAVNIPIQLHSHYTSGMASMTYLKAVEAGVDVIDTSLSVLSQSTSQPPTETMVGVLRGTPYDTGLDVQSLIKINRELKARMDKYSETLSFHVSDPEVLIYQVPGGMLSNLRNQMRLQNMSDKFEDVLMEVPRIREELGYPPLVTPMSQIVGTQAVFNVLTGQRYGIKSKEIKDYLKGLYGRSPGPISEDFRRSIIGDEEVITYRYADSLPPRLEEARQEIEEYITQDEDVLTYILFPEAAMEFFKKR